MRLAVLGLVLLLCISSVGAELYNMTNITNADGLYEQTKALNAHVNSLIGLGIIATVWVVTFVLIMSIRGVLAGMAAGSFIGLLSATMLLPLELIGFNIYTYLLLILGGVMFVSLIINRF